MAYEHKADRPLCSLDFETFYDKKNKYTLTEMTTWEYVHDDRFDAYLLAYKDADELWVGQPCAFDWNKLRGKMVAMHNAGFDGLVLHRLGDLGIMPRDIFQIHLGDNPRVTGDLELIDTADYAAYAHIKRSLDSVVKVLYGESVDKTMRGFMDGKTAADAKALGKWDDLVKYGGLDAEWTYRIAAEHLLPNWPEQEFIASQWQREQCWLGVHINVEYLTASLENCFTIRNAAAEQIPWDWSKNKTPLAPTKIRAECAKVGIKMPGSLAKDSEECAEWEDENAEKYSWVKSIRTWRRSNHVYNVLENIRSRVRWDNTVPFSMKYFGTHTGRPAAEEGLNLLNLMKGEHFGVDVRRVFDARPNHVMRLSDLAQIEPRLLNLLAGNYAFLDELATGMSPYEIHARQTMGYVGDPNVDMKTRGKTDKQIQRLYDTAKGRVLAGGYACGYKKFIAMLPRYGIDPEVVFSEPYTTADQLAFLEWLERAEMQEDVTEFAKLDDKKKRWWVNSWKQIMAYRASSPLIVNLWANQMFGFRISAERQENYEVALPGGRVVTYYTPHKYKDEYWATVVRGEAPNRMYGGKIVENITQSLAREVFTAGLVRLLKAGVRVLWTVYDEYVKEIPLDKATPEYGKQLDDIICECPDWCAKCPIAVDSQYTPHYKK
jgi:hypothetical protein